MNMNVSPLDIAVQYNKQLHEGSFIIPSEGLDTAVFARLKLSIRSKQLEHTINDGKITLTWSDTLGIIREIGTRSDQINLNFRFRPDKEALGRIRDFAKQIREVQVQQNKLTIVMSKEDVAAQLSKLGFSRILLDFQLRDLSHLLSLKNGANFSVPGAGKTTVTFALHLLTRQSDEQNHILIVAPKSAFGAWSKVVQECLGGNASDKAKETFTQLVGSDTDLSTSLRSGATRFIISYDLAAIRQNTLNSHLSTVPTHLVLDESHRMKAGRNSQRGAFLLNIAPEAVRRDILTGTPMPQDKLDIASQLDFLWPGHGYGLGIIYGKKPKEVLKNLYVRTTKNELGLPKPNHRFIDIQMDSGQLALYSIVRKELLQNMAEKVSTGFSGYQLRRARMSVMRLLQLSINPVLALNAMLKDSPPPNSVIIDQVMEEGYPAKMQEVMKLSRKLAKEGKKSVIWTIFTDTIHSFASAIAELNPVIIHGGVPLGSRDDRDSREGRLHRFHEDDGCFVLIANPATAGEGIDLHTVCHDAIYADRSYVSTHYMQSTDRIHRLGLKPNEQTNIHIFRSTAPSTIGSIDRSVSRRLAKKIRNMQKLLDDQDLHELAFVEEEAADPLDYDVDLNDIVDLISEFDGKIDDSKTEQA